MEAEVRQPFSTKANGSPAGRAAGVSMDMSEPNGFTGQTPASVEDGDACDAKE